MVQYSSRVQRNTVAFVGRTILLLAAVSACGSGKQTDALPFPDSAGIPGHTPVAGLQVIGTVEASVKNGRLQFQSFQPAGVGPGTKTQNFGGGDFAQDAIFFRTNPGNGLGTGTCTGTQYCATVELGNYSGLELDDLFVEITGYQNVVPPTETISWAGSPFTYSQAYASAFANPGDIEAAFYGDLGSNQTKSTEWKFNVGMSQGFNFTIAVLASVGRSDYTSWTKLTAPVVDACAVAGHSSYLTSTDDAETDVALPFPFTFYDKTYDRAVLGSNGYALFERSDGAAPSLGTGATNGSVTSGAPPGLYPFWDDLAFDADGGVCVATTGAAPSRTFAITWKNAKINAAQPGKGTWSPSRITTSLLLSESTDQYAFEYLLPDHGITDLTRGLSATIGEVGIVQGVETGTNFSDNASWYSIPAIAGSYPFEWIRSTDANPVQTPTAYSVSADGKYYNVNLLRRNYPPPTANAAYSGNTTQYLIYDPSYSINGDDSPFIVSGPAAGDTSAVVTLTVDMGQYFSVGAVRPLYYYTGNNPANHRIRLATTPGQWTTVPTTPPLSNDNIYSFDAIQARYVELTMMGTNATGAGMALSELFVYPSAEGVPPPSTNEGYDLGYLATTTANSNAWTPDPELWPAGDILARIPTQSYAPYATGDAVGTVDLGGLYPVSRLSLGFYSGSNWANGGRLETAADPGAYMTVYDSGLGNLFGTQVAPTEEFSFPARLVRYIRVTDYYAPEVGASGGILQSVQAFPNPAPRVAYYPLSADGKYFTVNLARRPVSGVQPSASVVYASGALAYTPIPQAEIASNVLDGDDLAFAWRTLEALPDATATVTVDLGQVQQLGAVRLLYGNQWPVSSSIRIAATAAGPWTSVLEDAPVTTNDITSSFDTISARYVELTMKGTTAIGIVSLVELQAFPSSASNPAPSSESNLDLTYLTGMAISTNSNTGVSNQSPIHSVAGAFSYYVKSAAQGATGDAAVTLDLGQQYQVSQVGLYFYANQNWPAGGKIDVDDGSGNWVNVFDSGHGTTLGPVTNGTQTISFATRPARLVRITGYFDPTAAQGLLYGIEVF